jgi:hypothetical protein
MKWALLYINYFESAFVMSDFCSNIRQIIDKRTRFQNSLYIIPFLGINYPKAFPHSLNMRLLTAY